MMPGRKVTPASSLFSCQKKDSFKEPEQFVNFSLLKYMIMAHEMKRTFLNALNVLKISKGNIWEKNFNNLHHLKPQQKT